MSEIITRPISVNRGTPVTEIALPEPWPLPQDTLAYESPWQEGTLALYWLATGKVRLILRNEANECLLTFISPLIAAQENGQMRLEVNRHAPQVVLDINGETVLSYDNGPKARRL